MVSNADSSFTLDLAEREAIASRQLSRSFTAIVERIADDPTSEDMDGGSEKVSLPRAIERATSRGLSPNYVWVDKKRTSLFMVLDTSGSCASQADIYRRLAQVAAAHDDIRIFDGPNGHIMREFNPKSGVFEKMPERELTSSSGFMTQAWPKFMNGATVLFFGDADGWQLVVEASWRMNVYWMGPWRAAWGNAPTHPRDYGCYYSAEPTGYEKHQHEFRRGLPKSADEFKGKFDIVTDEADLVRVAKKIR